MYDIIVKDSNKLREILLIENGILVEKIVQQDDIFNMEGDIFLGKVQNVLNGMQAAFVDIGEEKNTFIHVKDILPKVDETCEKKEITKNITEIVKPGMPLLVQVKRIETEQKGAKVSTHISISGKYIVFMPDTNFVTISQKIEDEKEKQRLTNIVKKLLPKGSGAIIRTAAIRKNRARNKRRCGKASTNMD